MAIFLQLEASFYACKAIWLRISPAWTALFMPATTWLVAGSGASIVRNAPLNSIGSDNNDPCRFFGKVEDASSAERRFASKIFSSAKTGETSKNCYSQDGESNPGPAHYECAALPTEPSWQGSSNIPQKTNCFQPNKHDP